MEEFKHYTVMKHEAVDALECKSGKVYVDCTLGGGGHSELILQKIQPGGHLIAFDVDDDAIKASSERLKDYKNLTIVKSSYTNIRKVLKELGIEKISGGVLFDLGASYHQFNKGERGFSFSKEAKLDMRFNQDANFSAYDVVNTYSEDDLVKIFSEYGEERFSKRIAKKIIEQRKLKKLETTTELADLIMNCTPHAKSSIHPATRVFQAIRIEVNDELGVFERSLKDALDLIDINGRICVITFHSLEDKICKEVFKSVSEIDKNIKKLPIIPEEYQPKFKTIANIKPSKQELEENARARSAKLRVIERVK